MARSKRTKQNNKNKQQSTNKQHDVNFTDDDHDAFGTPPPPPTTTTNKNRTTSETNNNNSGTTATESASTTTMQDSFPEDIVPSFTKFIDQTLIHPQQQQQQQQKEQKFVGRNTNHNQRSNKFQSKSTSGSMIQHVLLACVLGYMIQKHFLKSYLLPYGPAQEIGYPDDYHSNKNNNKYTLFHYDYEPSIPVDYTNKLLQIQPSTTTTTDGTTVQVQPRVRKIYERIEPNESQRLLVGHETILFDEDGIMYVMTTSSKLVKVDDIQPLDNDNSINNNSNNTVPQLSAIYTARTTIMKDLGLGRPLGGAFAYSNKNNNNNNNNKNKQKTTFSKSSTLYICDAVLGLTRIQNIHDPTSNLEIIASEVLDEVITVHTYYDTTTINNNTTEDDIEIEGEGIENKNQSKITKRNGKVVRTETRTTYQMTPINFANDITIGPKTGKVYFTDSTNIPPIRVPRRRHKQQQTSSSSSSSQQQQSKKKKKIPSQVLTSISYEQHSIKKKYYYDTMYTSKIDYLRQGIQKTGRLLVYDPTTNMVEVLLRNLHFPNGLAIIDSNEDSLLLSETFGTRRIIQYYIQNRTSRVILDGNQLPGYLDGADCIWSTTPTTNTPSSSSMCYVVMPSSIVPVAKMLNYVPRVIHRYIRTILMSLPMWLTPSTTPFGGLIEIQIETTTTTPSPTNKSPTTPTAHHHHRFLLDPVGRDLRGLTGVTHHKNQLYFGSLENDYIGVYNLLPVQ